MEKNHKNIDIRSLISHPDSPEVWNRAKIETPDINNDPLIQIDIRSTTASIEKLNTNFPNHPIQYGFYNQAPYCTCVLFKDRCYYSPNILSRDAPVRLPMIVFQKNSHGYKKLSEYFEYLWDHKTMLSDKEDVSLLDQNSNAEEKANDMSVGENMK